MEAGGYVIIFDVITIGAGKLFREGMAEILSDSNIQKVHAQCNGVHKCMVLNNQVSDSHKTIFY